jgi:Restriction endonuclease S subunits
MTELPPNWVRTKVGDVCRIVSGATPSTKEPRYWGGNIPWITPDDLSRNPAKFTSRGRRLLTQEGYDSCSTQLVPPGSVLFSSRAPIGYVTIASVPLCTNQGFKTCVPPSGIDSSYLYWYLRFKVPEIRSRASGTTFKEISAKRFAETELLVPPLPEQRRIVTTLEYHLSRLDAGNRFLGSAEARLRTLVDRTRDEFIDRYGSELRPLADVLREPLANGRSVPTDPNGFPVLRLTALRKGRLDLGERKGGRWSAEEAKPFLVRQGDFYISRGNGSLSLVGRGALLSEEPDPIAFPDTMIRIRVDDKTVLPQYLQMIWDSRLVREQIEGAARTTAGIYKINQKIIEDLRIPVPSIADQQELIDRIGRLSDAVTRNESLVTRARAQADRLRQALMAEAFSGRLAPQLPCDEPASVLLERIKTERSAATPRRRRSGRRIQGTTGGSEIAGKAGNFNSEAHLQFGSSQERETVA